MQGTGARRATPGGSSGTCPAPPPAPAPGLSGKIEYLVQKLQQLGGVKGEGQAAPHRQQAVVAQQAGVVLLLHPLPGRLSQLQGAEGIVGDAGHPPPGIGHQIVDRLNAPSQAGEHGGEGGVGVDHPVHILPPLVKQPVEVQLTGGLAFPLHHLALQIGHHHVLRGGGKIVHARGADGHEAPLPVKDAEVAEGSVGKAGGHQLFAVLHHQLPLLL